MNEPVRITTITEEELENYLVANPSQIREGLTFLSRQFRTDSGPLDMLVLDDDGMIWVIELKVESDDGQLIQGLRYYDYVRSNIESIARGFSGEGHEIDVNKGPGLILVSTDFTSTLKRITKYVSVPIDLFEAMPIEIPSGEKQVLCRNVDLGAPYEPLTIPTREGNLAYIEDESVRNFCRKCLEQLESKGAEIRPLKGEWFTMRHSGKIFMSLGCKQKFFSVYVIMESDDSLTVRFRIKTQQDWRKDIEPHLVTLGLSETS